MERHGLISFGTLLLVIGIMLLFGLVGAICIWIGETRPIKLLAGFGPTCLLIGPTVAGFVALYRDKHLRKREQPRGFDVVAKHEGRS